MVDNYCLSGAIYRLCSDVLAVKRERKVEVWSHRARRDSKDAEAEHVVIRQRHCAEENRFPLEEAR